MFITVKTRCDKFAEYERIFDKLKEKCILSIFIARMHKTDKI